MSDWDYTEAKLEREATRSCAREATSQTSIAISLKRIADILEKIEAKMPYVQTIIGPAIGAKMPYVQTIIGPAIGAAQLAGVPQCTCGSNGERR